MKLDTRLKIKKTKDLPIGKVIDCPKEYLYLYYVDVNGAVKKIMTNKKLALKELTAYINNRTYLFQKN
jgi:hypothetical protein